MAGVSLRAIAGEWTVTPSIAVSETASDNLFLSSSESKSGLVSAITPGISINGAGSRAKLRLNYQLYSLFYSVDPSQNNQLQNSLNASGSLEAIEKWFFIDATGTISQQSLSPFGAAPVSASVSTSVNDNIAETGVYTVSPYIRGEFGSVADYLLRYTLSSSHSKGNSAYNSDTETWLGQLSGKTRLASVGWSVDGSATVYDQGSQRTKKDNRVRGVIYYQIDPQFQVSLIGGSEQNNYETLDMESSTIAGAGFKWTPTERTELAFSREERFFGPANTFSFSHRTPLSAWQASASEDVTSNSAQQSVTYGTYADLLNQIFSSLPDAERAAAVQSVLDRYNLDGDAQMQGGYLSNSTVLRQLRQFSVALIGARNTVTFAATQSQTQSISLINGLGVDIGSGGSANNVDQFGANLNWSHRLTPQSSLIGSVAYLNSQGTGTNTMETTQKLFTLSYTTTLGPKTYAGVSLRHVIADGTTEYTENAVVATLTHRF